MREIFNEKTIVLNFRFNKNDILSFKIINLEFEPDEVVLKHFIISNSTKYTFTDDPDPDKVVDDRGFIYSLRTNMIDASNPFHSMYINTANDPTGDYYTGYPLPIQVPFLIRQPINNREFIMELKNYDGNNISIVDSKGLDIYISLTFTFIKYK